MSVKLFQDDRSEFYYVDQFDPHNVTLCYQGSLKLLENNPFIIASAFSRRFSAVLPYPLQVSLY
jgi:hypothetical protein